MHFSTRYDADVVPTKIDSVTENYFLFGVFNLIDRICREMIRGGTRSGNYFYNLSRPSWLSVCLSVGWVELSR